VIVADPAFCPAVMVMTVVVSAAAGEATVESVELLRDNLYENLPGLQKIAGDDKAPAADRLRAMDLQARYGLGTLSEISVDNVRDRLGRTLAIIRDTLGEEDAERLITLLQPVWTA